jgi:hypothetical protein
MKSVDLWESLARTARGVRDARFAEMPFGFDLRVTAQWERTQARPIFSYWFRRGAIIASLVMFFSVLATYQVLTEGEPDELAVADTVLRASLDYE